MMMMTMTLLLVVHKGSVVIHVLTVYKEENATIHSWYIDHCELLGRQLG